jgi:hypothetical protein
MHFKTTAAALTAGLALAAAPAIAAHSTGQATGKATAPGQLCKAQSHKKTNHGKGKSPFAACVVGATREQHQLATTTQGTTTTHTNQGSSKSPAKLCADQSKKKSATDKKSPFAACVTGVAKAKQDAQDNEGTQTTTTQTTGTQGS